MNMPVTRAISFATNKSNDPPREAPEAAKQEDFESLLIVSAQVAPAAAEHRLQVQDGGNADKRDGRVFASSDAERPELGEANGTAAPTSTGNSNESDGLAIPPTSRSGAETATKGAVTEPSPNRTFRSQSGESVAAPVESTRASALAAEGLMPLSPSIKVSLARVEETLAASPHPDEAQAAVAVAFAGSGVESDLGPNASQGLFDIAHISDPSISHLSVEDPSNAAGAVTGPTESFAGAVDRSRLSLNLGMVREMIRDRTRAEDIGTRDSAFPDSVEPFGNPTGRGVGADGLVGAELKPKIESPLITAQIENPLVELANSLRAAGDRRVLKMRLNPAELGSVEVTVVRHASGSVTATLSTEREAARAALHENATQLRESLERAGVRVEKLEIDFRPSSSSTMDHGAKREAPSGGRSESFQPRAVEDRDGISDSPGVSEERLVSLRA